MKRSLSIKNCQVSGTGGRPVRQSKAICIIPKVKSLMVVLVGILVLSSVGYIFEINRLATMGQKIDNKEQFLEELKEQNRSLELEVAHLKSSYHFEEERKKLGLVNPEQVSFIEIKKEESVAMAR